MIPNQFYSYDVMLKCWREKPNERPSFKNIVSVLTTMTENQDDQVLLFNNLNKTREPGVDFETITNVTSMFYKAIFDIPHSSAQMSRLICLDEFLEKTQIIQYMHAWIAWTNF